MSADHERQEGKAANRQSKVRGGLEQTAGRHVEGAGGHGHDDTVKVGATLSKVRAAPEFHQLVELNDLLRERSGDRYTTLHGYTRANKR